MQNLLPMSALMQFARKALLFLTVIHKLIYSKVSVKGKVLYVCNDYETDKR